MSELNTTAIRKLIRVLSGAEPWPRDFEWDFETFYTEYRTTSCGCAVGLAYKLNLIPKPDEEYFQEILNLTDDEFDNICTKIGYDHVFLAAFVTPEMVSRKFEQLLIEDEAENEPTTFSAENINNLL